MGITRDSRHKRRLTGGRVNVHKKKRKYEMGRPMAQTRLGHKRVRVVKCRGKNTKYRALKLDAGNFSWGSENCTRKVRCLDVVYNASNNELVRTKTLVKNAIIQVDATPFKVHYFNKFGVELGKNKKLEAVKKSGHVAAKQKGRLNGSKLDQNIQDQFNGGRLLACISSRPGQTGRVDGYILEGDELAFYKKKLERKRR